MKAYGIPKRDNKTCEWGCCTFAKVASKCSMNRMANARSFKDRITRYGRKKARAEAKAEASQVGE